MWWLSAYPQVPPPSRPRRLRADAADASPAAAAARLGRGSRRARGARVAAGLVRRPARPAGAAGLRAARLRLAAHGRHPHELPRARSLRVHDVGARWADAQDRMWTIGRASNASAAPRATMARRCSRRRRRRACWCSSCWRCSACRRSTVTRRETGSGRNAPLQFAYMSVLAYVCALIVVPGASLDRRHPVMPDIATGSSPS